MAKPPELDAAQLESVRKFAKCMRENGIPDFPVPDPHPDRSGFAVESGDDEEKFRAAMDQCRLLMPARPGGPGLSTGK